MIFKDYCEELYQEWRNKNSTFNDFGALFETEYLIEPYYPLFGNGNELIIINNNPGRTHNYQHILNIKKEFKNSTPYSEIAKWLQNKYVKTDEGGITGSAKSRLSKMQMIAEKLNCNDVETIETFFLHSSKFDKIKFLRKFEKNPRVILYWEMLQKYLENKKVIVVACISSKSSITKEVILSSDWLKKQCEIIGLDINSAHFQKTSEKTGKITSGIFYSNNKYLICTMGSNSIPTKAVDFFRI